MYEGRCPYCGGLLLFGGVKIDEVSAGFAWGFNMFSRRWLKWQSSESVEHSRRAGSAGALSMSKGRSRMCLCVPTARG